MCNPDWQSSNLLRGVHGMEGRKEGRKIENSSEEPTVHWQRLIYLDCVSSVVRREGMERHGVHSAFFFAVPVHSMVRGT